MMPTKPRRTVIWGLGLVLLSAGVGSHARDAEAEPPVVDPVAVDPAVDDGGALAAEDAADPVAAPDVAALGAPWDREEGPLRGRPGAATALIVRDPATALALLDAQAPPVEGSPEWFVEGALRGRALRMQARPGDAVQVLEPRLVHPAIDQHFPRDVLGFELARARVEWADHGELDPARADEQRDAAVGELGKIRKLSSVRNLAQMRVLQAQAMAGIEGDDDRARARAAARAAKAMAKIVADYPHHPRAAELRLTHARALVRAGKASEGAAELRRIVIEQAGDPASDEAWADLATLAAASSKVKAPALSVAERLEQATIARARRRVDASRRILDELLADARLSSSQRRQALRSRSYTAYKQRDYETCVEDLRPIYETSSNHEVRDSLLRCYERGEMYDEMLTVWQVRVDSTRSSTRANGLWNGLDAAFRAGRYAQADRWLADYEKQHTGHRGERAWLRPWLAYRLGRTDEAIEGFRALANGRSGDATRASYFLGKLLLASDDPAQRAEGTVALQQLAAGSAWTYYGLMARQRLLDAAATTPPLPALPAVADEARRPTREQTEARLAELDARFGDAFGSLRRTRRLFEAGYLEEARRELRNTTSAYIDSKYGRSSGPRSESLIVGLGWKAEWEFPRARLDAAGRKVLRNDEEAAVLHDGLRELAHDLSEPYAWAKLSGADDGPYKARWHPRAYRASVEREARLRSIDPVHMWSLMYTESRFRRHVVSPVGARGALQIMPWTGLQLAERLGELPDDGHFDSDTLFDIDTNAHLAGYYVAELLHKFHGQAPMAYASYNGGPSNVGRWLRAKSKEGEPLELDTFIEEIAFEESYRYTKRVTEVSAAYSMLYRGELPRWTNTVDPVVEDNIAF